MLIRISITSTQPLTGTATADEKGGISFLGWLELIRAISELLAPGTPKGQDQEIEK